VLDNIRTIWRSRHTGYASAVEVAAANWTFKPFDVHGKLVRGCARDVIVYPPDRRHAVIHPPPPPPPPPRNVSPTALEANRIAGERTILPDEITRVEIFQSGKDS
jgi:hypothetical protein